MNRLTILKTVCESLNLTRDQILQHSYTEGAKKAESAWGRQLCMYLARKHTSSSLEATGRFYGQRSHCTVVHAVATVRNEIETNTFRRNQVQEIEDKLLKRKAIEISNEDPGDRNYIDPTAENLKHQKPVTSCFYSE